MVYTIEIKKMLEGISPWPWGMRKDGEGGWVIIHSDLDDEKHDFIHSPINLFY